MPIDKDSCDIEKAAIIGKDLCEKEAAIGKDSYDSEYIEKDAAIGKDSCHLECIEKDAAIDKDFCEKDTLIDKDLCEKDAAIDKDTCDSECIEKEAVIGKDSCDSESSKKDAAIGKDDNCDDPLNKFSKGEYIEPNHNKVVFKSFHVQKESQTPYSDATNATHDEKNIKRPMNAFMIFSHYERKKVAQRKPDVKCLGKKWKELPKESRTPYVQEAETLRQFHHLEYPGYRYKPRKKQIKPNPSVISMTDLPPKPQSAINRTKNSSFKLNNSFGGNSWVNSAVSSLPKVRQEPINPANLSLRVTIDSHFKERLKNSHHQGVEMSSLVKSSTPPHMSVTPDIFSSPYSSSSYSDNSVQSDLPNQYKSEMNKYDIHSIIEEFLSEPSSSFFNPCTPGQVVPLCTPDPGQTVPLWSQGHNAPCLDGIFQMGADILPVEVPSCTTGPLYPKPPS